MHRWLPFFVLATTLAAATAGADPVAGVYSSTDLGGALLTARASTSRACPNTCGGVLDVFDVQSWNGAALGTQWSASCGTEPAAYTVSDGRVAGTGPVTFTSTFTGGTFLLGPGPWGSGTATLGTTLNVTTVQYVNIAGVSTPVASRANVQTSGLFEGGCVLTFAIGNGIGVGESPQVEPANYPAFLDPGCAPTRVFGSWGDIGQIVMQIGCATPAPGMTWGTLKLRYR